MNRKTLRPGNCRDQLASLVAALLLLTCAVATTPATAEPPPQQTSAAATNPPVGETVETTQTTAPQAVALFYTAVRLGGPIDVGLYVSPGDNAKRPPPKAAGEPATNPADDRQSGGLGEGPAAVRDRLRREAAPIAEAAFAEARRLDRILSDYDPESDTRQLAAALAAGESRVVPYDLARVLRLSRDWAERTDRAFDPTLGSLTSTWRRARRRRRMPSPEALHTARSAAGIGRLDLSLRLNDTPPGSSVATARDFPPGMQFDFGGIAKGYVLDAMAQACNDWGVEAYLIDAGGDIVVSVKPPAGRQTWRIALAPLRRVKSEPQTFINLQPPFRAVATSGDAAQALEIDGRRYSHLFDPRTLEPLKRESSVTVLATSGTTADVLASAFSVLGPDGTRAWLASHPDESLAVRIAWIDDDELRTWQSENWPAAE